MIKFSNVSKSYSTHIKAVDSLYLHIPKGEFFVLIGPSGCGKTTTLKMINRLIDASSGEIVIDGQPIGDYDIHELRWEIGYVLQRIALFPHMTIAENIATVPELKRWSKEKTYRRVNELLDMIGLDPATYRNRMPDELSGGQQQRIGVVRALAADPSIVLMDEPFGALDPMSRKKLQNDIVHLQRAIKKTIVFVTHDMDEALKLGDRVGIMRGGKMVQIGTPEEIIQHPADPFVQKFIGSDKANGRMFIDLEKLVDPIRGETIVVPADEKTVSVTPSLQEILSRLAQYDQLTVERDGKIIGKINRRVVLQYLADHLYERGAQDG
ncbi:MAG TPA: ABC transporter ATP-binding protein [Bacillota bacterium]|nr:ABC transporter ATP-binding protein [Bacillota bacterium]